VSKQERLASIGRFAALVRMPVSTLRFYDEQGLLRPVSVDPDNHYRYYSLEQLDIATTIRILRDMDVPSYEIREVLEAGAEESRRALEHHRCRMLERERKARETVRRLDGLLGQGEHALLYDITQAEVEPLRVISRRATPRRVELDATIVDLATELRAALGEHELPPDAPREITLYHSILRRDGLIDLEVCVPVPETLGEIGGSIVLKGGAAARLIHRGRWDDVYLAYASLFSWALRNGHELDGPLREVYAVDDRDTPRASRYVTELTWLLA
jgi:DNA-binding transcriptional MerR regulator